MKFALFEEENLVLCNVSLTGTISLGINHFVLEIVNMHGDDSSRNDIYTALLDALPVEQVQRSDAVSSNQTLPFSEQLSSRPFEL